MPATGAGVKGLKETMRSLQRLGVEVSELKESMANIADKGAQDAMALAPVGATGALVASIRGNKAKATAIVKAGSKRVDYAVFNEFGTSSMSAKEFVTKAVEQNKGYAVEQIESDLQNIIRRLDLN